MPMSKRLISPAFGAVALCACVLAGVFPQPVVAGGNAPTLTSPEQVLVENRHMTVKDGFGAQFWLTSSDRFFMNWVKADTRNLTPVAATRRSIPLYLAVFIVDPGVKKTVRPDGTFKLISDVTYDFQVFKPDGTPYPGGGAQNVTGLSGRPSAQHMVTLLYGKATVTFDLIDQPGDYTIKVVVHDNIRQIHIPLTRTVALQD